jgi:hypothetical protein
MNWKRQSAPWVPGVVGRDEGVCVVHKIVVVTLIAALFCVSGMAQNNRQVQRTPGQSPQPLQQGSQQPAPPVFTSFSPTQGSTGSTVTITFNGANFVARAMNLTFSPSQGITVSGLKVTSSAQITAQVQIGANAQLGSRQVFLVDGDHDLQIPTPFMITAAAQNNCPPGMLTPAGCGTTQSAAPALRGFAPVQGTQGTTVALTFSGINLISPAALLFTPNSGITVLSATITNGNQIQAQISIAPNASLGSRNVIVTVGGQTKLTASNTFTVMSGAPTARITPMQILRVVPNQIAAGSQNVDLTLEGTNFVPGTQVTFTIGAGVPANVFANGPARYINSTEMHVSVNALPSALPGGRDINLQPPGQVAFQSGARVNGQSGASTQQVVVGKGMLNVLAVKPSGPPTVLKIPPITLQKFAQGVIRLDAPLGAVTQSDQYETFAVPLLDDNAVFKWHEQNPGLADYYELRVYAKDGKTLLATQTITGKKTLALGAPGGFINVVPTYYRPDPGFLKTVLEPTRKFVFSGLQTVGVVGHAVLQSNAGSGSGASPPAVPDQLNGKLSQGDLQWEVAGFHTYNKNGVATQPQLKQVSNGAAQNASAQLNAANAQNAGGTIDVQVEISDRWPLMAPLAPTGLACSGTGITTGNLQIQNLSKTSTDPNSYVGDKWSLGGTIDLSRSPYLPDFTSQTAVPPGSTCGNQCLVKDVTQVDFSNVFVDWGDGTVVPLAAPPVSANVTNWDPSQPVALPTNATSTMRHAYQVTGGFTVRVYQISSEDLQHVSESAISSSVDGPTTPFLQTALLSKMASQGGVSKSGLTLIGVQTNFQQILSQGSGSSPASQAAGDAYMLYCQTLNITVPEDLAADGPLHLKGIEDPDFGAYDISRFKTPVLDHVAAGSQVGRPTPPSEIHAERAQTGPPAGAGKPDAHGQVVLEPIRAGGQQPAAICSSCDDGIDAITSLQYYGRGSVRVTWVVDGVQSQQTLSIGPSQARKNLTRQGFTTIQGAGMMFPVPIPEPPIIISNSKPIDSPGLQIQPLGNHNVLVEADVLPRPTAPNLSNALSKALGSMMPSGLAAGSSAVSNGGTVTQAGPNIAEAQSLLNTLAPPAGSNLPPLKIGLLSGSNKSVSGLGAVQYVNGPLQQVVSQLAGSLPDQHVASNTKIYEVVASDPSKPCKFLFSVRSGGSFEISGIQNHVTQQGGTYSGTGNLILHLANSSSGGYDEYPPVPVQISNWSVPDGLHVQTGSIDVSPNVALAASVPGLQGSIQRLSGQAGGELDATLNVSLSDDTLREPGELPVAWSGVQAELRANGDWIKDGLTLPKTLIGWSAFTMQSSSVRLDLSHHDGDAAGSLCGPLGGADWVGVRFPSLAITPYTMNLVSSSSLQPTVTDWGVTGSGLCGALNTGPFTAGLGKGSVSFQSINAAASNGNFTAQYNGMDVYVPWLVTHLKGNATLQSGGGKQANISFPLSSPSVTKSYGNFGFTASNLKFTEEQNVGWVVQANTHFVFSAQNKTFSAFDQIVNFGMDGRGYFAQGNQAKDISLGGSSTLGQTPVDLASVHLTAPPSGPQVLAVLFSTNVHLSEVMAAATAQVNYSVDNSGTNYTATGPSFAPFTIDVPYPSGQPSADAKVHPVYSGSGGSGGDEISGSVDLSELGGPPITGEFRLGYQGGHDYWLTRITYALGPTGLPIISVPPVMNLYRVQGGLGHNFPINAFEDTGSLKAELPVMDNSFLFMAGIRVGMPDQFTYTLDGDLAIKAGGQDAGARIDFHAWLLKMADSGNGDFQGYLQYSGGNFDARLWGHLSLLGGVAAVDLGNSANNAAVDMHFGPSGPWHVDAGKQQGPRISGQLLDTTANMYLMLSDAGLSIGGGESISLDVGDDSVASAYVRGDVDIGLTITPQPHISGDFSASVSAGVCVDSVCVSAGVSAQIHAEALPLEVQASASIGLPWPLGSISFSVHL